MKRPIDLTALIWILAFVPLGCSENEAERKQREQIEGRNVALRAEASSEKLKAQLVTNAVVPAKKAVLENNQAALTEAVAQLKKLGGPAVERLLEDATKQEKADRIAAITVLGEMGPDAAAAATMLEGMVKEDVNSEIREAASKALAKIRTK